MSKHIVQLVDHTNLKPEAAINDIEHLCREAEKYKFYAVCVNPVHVSIVREFLTDSGIKICSVAGFPLGANHTEIKLRESVKAVSDGAHEIDMVAGISWFKMNEYKKAAGEIELIRNNLPFNIVLKVIVEATLLTDNELTEAAKTVIDGGAEFIKTSTGFFGGANISMVRKIKNIVADTIEIKASGGIKSYQSAIDLVNAGASRIGSSASVVIAQEAVKHEVS